MKQANNYAADDSKVKPQLWMVEKWANERFDEIEIEGIDSINREDLLKYIRSNLKD